MTIFLRILLASVFVASSACSTGMNSEQGDQIGGSQLTSVTVALPAKASLPDSLKSKDLYYCFAILSDGDMSQMAVPASANAPVNPCHVGPVYSDFSRQGDYAENVKLEHSLDSKTSYTVSLIVGVKYSGPYSIDDSQIYYQGIDRVEPSDMAGKSKLHLELIMEKMGDGVGPNTIPSGKPVDLEVKPVFVDEGASIEGVEEIEEEGLRQEDGDNILDIGQLQNQSGVFPGEGPY